MLYYSTRIKKPKLPQKLSNYFFLLNIKSSYTHHFKRNFHFKLPLNKVSYSAWVAIKITQSGRAHMTLAGHTFCLLGTNSIRSGFHPHDCIQPSQESHLQGPSNWGAELKHMNFRVIQSIQSTSRQKTSQEENVSQDCSLSCKGKIDNVPKCNFFLAIFFILKIEVC